MRLAKVVSILAVLAMAGVVRAEGEKRSLGPSILRRQVAKKKAEQGILTPVPIEIELPPDLPARRVLVHYKLFGVPHWSTLELRPAGGSRYAGALSCFEVSTVTGDISYYIRIHDGEGSVIAYSGSRAEPYKVTIVHDTARPDLASGAGRCPDPADCPRGLPGCPSEPVERVPCKSDVDCEGGLTCGWDGFCEASTRRRNWLSVEAEQGAGLIATAGACSIASQENEGYACYRDDGATYAGAPVLTNEPLRVGRSTTRVALGYERLVFLDTTVGARVSYAVAGSGPTARGGTPFFPLAVELRAAHWFGTDPFARLGLRLYGVATAGFGMFDTRVSHHVREDPGGHSLQGGNDLEQTVTLWRRAGDGYVSAGAGAVWAFDADYGLSCEARVLQTFPFGATLFLAQLGLRRGF